MRSRAWGLLIVVIILAAVILTVILVWGGEPEPAPSTPTPTSTLMPTANAASSTPTMPPTEPPTPAPLVHVVREGDTLSSIAQAYGVTIPEIIEANSLTNPDVLSIGQEIIIPGHFITPTAPPPTGEPPSEPHPSGASPTAAAPPDALPSPLPSLTPSGPPVVEIWQVLGPDRLAVEMVVVRNRGGLANLGKWTLSDAEGNSFVFPSLTLFTDGEVRIHSASGLDTPTDLHWGRTAPAWHSGELIALKDAEGNTIDTYIVP
ncbi:MAG: LysM peptidoglycan-binding domain-containing protein [Anaerolineae bacterium]|nr:LysM peptidoglycan-binding domain-containing protein [Anaerolineae bacterium]